MIPKRIFTIWLGDAPPELLAKCMETHKLPGFEHRMITLENCHHNKYIDEAIRDRCWVKAADYLRLYYLYMEGGIYLDSGCKMIKPFNSKTLGADFFACKEHGPYWWVANSIIGSVAGHHVLRECLDKMDLLFGGADGKTFNNGMDLWNHVVYKYRDEILLLPPESFMLQQSGITLERPITEETFGIHFYTKLWVPHIEYISSLTERSSAIRALAVTDRNRCLIVLIEGREFDARLQKAYNSIREAKPDWPCVVLYRGPLKLGPHAHNVVHIRDLPKIPDIKTYSKILTHEKFYEAFSPFEFVLITQSDTAMAKCPTKPIEDFFKYDYSGAVLWRKYVGNGGFSLRNRRACLDVCRKNPSYSKDEDELFCKEITNKCPIEEASYFSVESRYFNHESNSFSGVRWPHFFSPKVIPCGMHRMNEYFPEEFMILQLLDSGFASYSSYDD